MHRRFSVVVVGTVLVVAAVGAAPALAAGAAATNSAGASEGAVALQTGTCNYTSVYDQTIDSVVAITTDAGAGSGFVYRTAGNGTSHVVTNAHVVGDADSVTVQYARGESTTADVVGRDRLTDLAAVRVNGTPDYVDALSVAETNPSPGRAVAALGNPFGLEDSITHGIVSGVNRSMPTQFGFSIPDTVQTDAPINPGNSGGPLVTCDGTVVGVNTAGIASPQAENVGFAVSATLVQTVVPELIEAGEFEHAFLGIQPAEITPQIAQANDLDVTEGVYVISTAEGSPAAGALRGATGFETVNDTRVPVGGDVIVGVEGQPTESPEDLGTYLVTETSPGESVTITVVRDGQRRQVNVTLGERPEPTTT